MHNSTLNGKKIFSTIKCKRIAPRLLCAYKIPTLGVGFEFKIGNSAADDVPVIYCLVFDYNKIYIACYNMITNGQGAFLPVLEKYEVKARRA